MNRKADRNTDEDDKKFSEFEGCGLHHYTDIAVVCLTSFIINILCVLPI